MDTEKRRATVKLGDTRVLNEGSGKRMSEGYITAEGGRVHIVSMYGTAGHSILDLSPLDAVTLGRALVAAGKVANVPEGK